MKTIKKIIILLVALAIIGDSALVYQALNELADKKSTISSDAAAQQVKQDEFNEALKKTAAVDQDFDGIADTEEVKYKTNILSSDTDEDGLTDREEVFNFKTDPLKADTDRDGINDAQEVRRGFDPVKI